MTEPYSHIGVLGRYKKLNHHRSYNHSPLTLSTFPSPLPLTMTEAFAPGVALVTGASQGIGRAMALRLARDGIDVAVNDIRAKATQLEDVVMEIQSLGRKSIPLIADVSVEEEVKSMVTDTVQSLGSLDIVSFSAGEREHYEHKILTFSYKMIANAGIVGPGDLATCECG